MKKILALIVMAIVLTTGVLAGNSFIDPDAIAMDPGTSEVVEYCLRDESDDPLIGYYVWLDYLCEDFDDTSGCDPGDDYGTTELTVTVLETQTQSPDGCAEVQLTLSNDADGDYWYNLNGDEVNGAVNAYTSETGYVYIPEMGVIGAMLVLGGAGLFIARKRN